MSIDQRRVAPNDPERAGLKCERDVGGEKITVPLWTAPLPPPAPVKPEDELLRKQNEEVRK